MSGGTVGILNVGAGDIKLTFDKSNPAIAEPLLAQLLLSPDCTGVLELSAGLGTAVLGKPVTVTELFAGTADSDRLDHSKWAWPLTDVRPFKTPIPCRGFQGFWDWSFSET